MSDDRKVQVSVEARIDGLVQGMTASQEKVASSTSAMTASVNAMASGVSEASARIKEEVALMGEKFEGVASKFSKISGAFLAVGAVLAGGEMFERMIGHTSELAEHLEVVSQKTGLTTQEIQKLDYAAKMCEVSAETLEKGMQRLAMNMQASVQSTTGPAALAFQNLGIKVEDASGRLRPINDVLMELAARFKDMPNGTQKTADAMAIFGRSGADMIPFLNKGRDGIAELGVEAERLGVVMDGQAIDASLAYSESMKKLKTQAEGLIQKLAVELMPSLQALAEMFTKAGEKGSSLGAILDGLGYTVKGITTLVLGLKMTFDLLVTGIQGFVEMAMDFFDGMVSQIKLVVEDFGHLADVIKDVFTGHFSEASEIINKDFSKLRDGAQNMADDIGKNWDKSMDALLDKATANSNAIKALWSDPIKPKKEGGDGDAGDANAKAPKPPKDRLAALKEELKEMEDARADDNQMSKTEVSAYWKNILDTERLSAKERIEVYHEYVAARRAAEKEEATAAKAAAKQAAEVVKLQDEEELAHAEAGFTEKRAMLDGEVAAHKITAAQKLQIEKQLLDQEYALELAALKKRLELDAQDPVRKQQALKKRLELDAQDPVRKQQALNAIQKLEDKYRLDKLKLDTQLVKKEETLWEQMYKKIGAAAQQNINGMIQGTESFQKAASNIANSIAMDWIQMGEEMLVNWIKNMAGAKVASIDTATTQVTANASVGGSAAAASAAQDGPYGWMIAIGAGLAVMAGIRAMMPSAEGGYDIPAGVNPITQLHQREMVLPAEHADTIRSLKGGGAGGHTFHISAMDGRDVERVLRRHGVALGKGIRGAVRNGQLGRRG